ncbi:CASP8 and FADD-like apoptosis regulator a isoform X1 [Entelurus aequoreus]|uniref:CASP8 and FADD-like apoptosis regulator a isoform X1 n=1 Tax=Entelurus aequoreus TaxID=161455 RepID=UPI002B1E0FC3|nr:CASP8 and FADD-like apoptosis regulator a isoform X1 [Entelurus aequoreus]
MATYQLQCFNTVPSLEVVPDIETSQRIDEILEALNRNERKEVLYLCESLHKDNTAACLKETLYSRAMSYGTAGNMFLLELLVHLGRYDIVRKVFGFSRDAVQRNMGSWQVLPRFRVLMTQLSEDMTSDDVIMFKFLLFNILGRKRSEQAKNFLDIVIELEHLGEVSSQRVDILEECLVHIRRVDLANKLKVYKKSGNTNMLETKVQQTCQSHVNKYKFSSKPRGLCVIIDCVGNDGEMLEHTFKSLHFSVTLHKYLSVAQTVSVLRGLSQGSKALKGDGFVCCIISRTTATHLLATDSYDESLPLDDLSRLFAGDVCSALVDQPKLFFIQGYRVPEFQPCARLDQRDEDLETDGGVCPSSPSSIPSRADVFWSHCWTGEDQLQQGRHRSVYLKALTDAMHRGQRGSRHLVDLHLEVNGAVFKHNSKCPGQEYHIDLKHTLRKELYF